MHSEGESDAETSQDTEEQVMRHTGNAEHQSSSSDADAVTPVVKKVLPERSAEIRESVDNDLSSTLRKTREQDRIKGMAVKRQIVC